MNQRHIHKASRRVFANQRHTCRLLQIMVAVILLLSLSFAAYANEALWPRQSLWTAIPFDNPTVSIQSSVNNPIVNSNGRLEIMLLAGKKPLDSGGIDIYPVIINIAGQWCTASNDCEYVTTDSNGFASIELQPGDYAIRLDERFGRVHGLYGVNVKSNDYGGAALGAETSDTSMITVSLHSGEIVAVMISLACLVVGVTTPDGLTALPDKDVYVYPEDHDIAGNPIPLNGYGSTGFQTSASGTCEWFLGAGTYTIRVDNANEDDTFIYGISLSPGEIRQVIATGD